MTKLGTQKTGDRNATSWELADYTLSLDCNLFPQLRTPASIANALYLAAANLRCSTAPSSDTHISVEATRLTTDFPITVELSSDKNVTPCIIVKLKNLTGFLGCNIENPKDAHSVHVQIWTLLTNMFSKLVPSGKSPSAMILGIHAIYGETVLLDATPHSPDY